MQQYGKVDPSMLARTLALTVGTGQITEVRALKVKKTDRYTTPVMSGFFDNQEKLIKAVAECAPHADGCYFIPNPVNPDLLGRAYNRLKEAKSGESTPDDQILGLHFLLVDLDFKRPSGISASDAEHQAALDRSLEIREWLREQSWPDPIWASSGNGGHLVYRVDPLLVSDSTLLQNCLNALGQRFDRDGVLVDQTCFNPSRIWKLYGTWARKGDPIPQRPHRISHIKEAPDQLCAVPKQLLLDLTAALELGKKESSAAQKEPARKNNVIVLHSPTKANQTQSQVQTAQTAQKKSFDITLWMRDHGLDVPESKPWRGGGQRWVFEACPWNPEHTDRSFFVVQFANGAIEAGCHHNSCQGKDWYALRDLKEPGWRAQREQRKEGWRDAKRAPSSGEDERPECFLPYGLEPSSKSAVLFAAAINDPPTMFSRGLELVQLVRSRAKAELVPYDGTSLRADLSERIRFQREKTINKEQVVVDADISLDICTNILKRSQKPFPPIEEVIHFPVFAPNGELIQSSGYNADLQAYVDLSGFAVDVPDAPSPDQIERAKSLIFDDLLFNFPFLDEASKANSVALGLLPFVRYMINAVAPPHLITATAPRTGKSLIVTLLSTIATGEDFKLLVPTDNDEEWRKRITTLLLKSPAVVCIDNVNKKLDSAVLAALFTSRYWTDRLMGGNKDTTLRNNVTWTITANNPQASEELTKRCVWIGLDAKMENPETRKVFKHPRITQWVQGNRKPLMEAFLTLIQAWIAKGQPGGAVETPMGGFEVWADMMGGILQSVEIPHFLENRKELIARTSGDSQEWKRFIAVWWEERREMALKVSEIRQIAVDAEMLSSVLGDKGEKSQDIRLGKALQHQQDRVWEVNPHATVRLKKDYSKESKSYRWLLHRNNEETREPARDVSRDVDGMF